MLPARTHCVALEDNDPGNNFLKRVEAEERRLCEDEGLKITNGAFDEKRLNRLFLLLFSLAQEPLVNVEASCKVFCRLDVLGRSQSLWFLCSYVVYSTHPSEHDNLFTCLK